MWSNDFIALRTRNGSALRILNVVDEFTRLALCCRDAPSIGASDVISELAKLFEIHGRPSVMRSDNGREFIAATVVEWLEERGVKTAFIEKGNPQQKPVRRALQRHHARRALERRRVR